MNFEPIIKAKLSRFKDNFGYTSLSDNEAFEHFVNYNLLYQQQPDAFFGNSEILDVVSTGNNNDLSIDGIAIFINGIIVKNKDDIDIITSMSPKIEIEFIFIQSKFSAKYDMGDFNNFCSGIVDFLSDEHTIPHNSKIEELLAVKDYALRDELMPQWKDSPSIKAYFVGIETKRALPHINGLCINFNKEVTRLNIFKESSIEVVDGSNLKEICDLNENGIDITFDVLQDMSLTAVEEVSNSSVVLCYAKEFMKLIKKDDGSLRKSVFSDNVRDFQGETSINKEISNTIHKYPKKFVLLNNGLTIVCDDFSPKNRTIKISNPQIVNGCQTSHALYYADRQGQDITEVPLVVKIIATHDSEITNQIVRGTNRQNIVYDEAFEATKPFHKDLESYFESLKFNNTTYYYERRSRQFQNYPNVKQFQKINFRSLIQSFVAFHIGSPHIAHRHESVLIKSVGKSIFQNNQSKHPYYVSSIVSSVLDQELAKDTTLKKNYSRFKFHILLIIKTLLSEENIDINHEKLIDKQCKDIMCKFEKDFSGIIKKAIIVFDNAREKWIYDGNSRDGIKDSSNFLKYLKQPAPAKEKQTGLFIDTEVIGEVLKTGLDKYGLIYGFIDYYPNNIFFHSKHSKIKDFSNIVGKQVRFTIVKDRLNRDVAADVELVCAEMVIT